MRKYIYCLSLCGLCYIGLYLYKYTDNEFGVVVIIVTRLYLHMAMRYVYLWDYAWIYLHSKYIVISDVDIVRTN